MKKPKLPEYPHPPARCSICGGDIYEYQGYEASRRAKYGNVYAHKDCLKKGDDDHDTTGEGSGDEIQKRD